MPFWWRSNDDERLVRIESQVICNREEIRRLSRLVGILIEQGKKMSQQLDDFAVKLARLTTVGDGMAALLKILNDELKAAGTDPAKLQALSASIDAKSEEWIAKTLENTPADPNNPPVDPNDPDA